MLVITLGTIFCMASGPGRSRRRRPNLPPTAVRLDPQAFYNQGDDLVFWGRMPILLLGLALAVLIFLWAREGFGFRGGILVPGAVLF